MIKHVNLSKLKYKLCQYNVLLELSYSLPKAFIKPLTNVNNGHQYNYDTKYWK